MRPDHFYSTHRETSFRSPDQVTSTDNMTPERANKYLRFVDLLQAVKIPNLVLAGISENFRKGVSVYGLFHYSKDGRVVKDIKVRLSDHVGRWSGHNVDLRNPKNVSELEQALHAQNIP